MWWISLIRGLGIGILFGIVYELMGRYEHVLTAVLLLALAVMLIIVVNTDPEFFAPADWGQTILGFVFFLFGSTIGNAIGRGAVVKAKEALKE